MTAGRTPNAQKSRPKDELAPAVNKTATAFRVGWNEDGDVFVLKGRDLFKLLAKNAVNEICMSTPAITDGQLLIRVRKDLFCIGE